MDVLVVYNHYGLRITEITSMALLWDMDNLGAASKVFLFAV